MDTTDPKHLDVNLSEEDLRLQRSLQELQDKTPQSEFGYPVGFYRADMLPWHDYEATPDLGVLFHNVGNGGDPNGKGKGQSDEGQGQGQGQKAERPDVLSDRLSKEPLGLEEEDLLDLDTDLDTDEYEAGIDDPDLDDLLLSPAVRLPAVVTTPSQNGDRLAGFRRVDLIPAFVPLSFEEGFPTLPDGRPCWDRLEWEPHEAHLAFQGYLKMPSVNKGIRALSDLPEILVQNNLIQYNGAGEVQYTAKFRNWFSVYYWNTRTKAYDIFKMAAFRKQQEFRAMDVQENHFGIATKLKLRLMEYLESDEEFWDMMSPKVGIEMLKMLTGMERLAAGLPAGAPLTEGKGVGVGVGGGGQSLEMILRTITQQQLPARQVDGEDGSRSGSALSSKILSDPKATQMAQELILRLWNPGSVK